MSQDEISGAAELDRQAQASPESTDKVNPEPKRRSHRWAKLILVALVAAVLGAAVSANWHGMPFSFIFVNAEIKAGAMIICSAALGFVLGMVFLWSALNRQ